MFCFRITSHLLSLSLFFSIFLVFFSLILFSFFCYPFFSCLVCFLCFLLSFSSSCFLFFLVYCNYLFPRLLSSLLICIHTHYYLLTTYLPTYNHSVRSLRTLALTHAQTNRHTYMHILIHIRICTHTYYIFFFT